MKSVSAAIDEAFVEKQRRRLVELHASLRAAGESAASEEAAVSAEQIDHAAEYEDGAQSLDALEREANLAVRVAARLEQVNRALAKIREGTYGLSDRSGKPIPRERLEVVPEALYTLSEEQSLAAGPG